MVVEVTGATLVTWGAAAAAVTAAAVFIGMAGSYDTNAVSNLAVNAWDRFPRSDMVWVEANMTHPGGYPELASDRDHCFVPPDGAAACPLSGDIPLPRCAPAGGTKFGCRESRPARTPK